MSRKALKVVVEVTFRAVSCPGVHLPVKDDIYLSVCFMGQYRQSEDLPAVFPLLFHEKMTFEKIFRHAVDPGDVTVMLQYETVRIKLVQLSPPAGGALAVFEEDARRFLFPEPKLVPSFSGVDQEVLMTRAPHFPGIAPRLEFSTKTTIVECLADADINIYPNVPMRPGIKRNRRGSGRPKTSSTRRKRSQSYGSRRGERMSTERQSTTALLSHTPRSQSLSPLRAENTHHLDPLRMDSATPGLADTSPTSTSQAMLALWRGASRSASPHRSALFTSSPLTRSSSTVRFSPTGGRKLFSNGLVRGIAEDDSSSSEMASDPLDHHHSPEPSPLWPSYKDQAKLSREWEEVHERVRGLLTTPKAVRRLVHGATVSEVDMVYASKSISPGPP